MKRAKKSVIKRLLYAGTIFISVFVIGFVCLVSRYHRVGFMCHPPRSFVKTHMLGNASSTTSKSTLLKHYCKYIAGYIGSREFLQNKWLQVHHDTLLDYKIDFCSYLD